MKKMYPKRLISLTLALILALLTGTSSIMLSSCALALPVSAAELSDGFSGKADVTAGVSDELKTALAGYSFSLLNGVLSENPRGSNDMVSPLSAALCLALVANGASGETLTQLETALGMDNATLNSALAAYSLLLTGGKSQLKAANSIWFRNEENRLHVSDSFLQANADWFGAQIYSAPFDDTTLTDINNWCSNNTDRMIDKMIDEIPADTVMYLINALSFDAKWETAFTDDDISENMYFTDYAGNTETATFLSSESEKALSTDGAYGFSKPYAGGKFSFVALLPDEGLDVYEFAAGLDGSDWLEMTALAAASGRTTGVSFPEFTYSASHSLKEVMKQLGVTDLFGNADLSRLGYSEAGGLFVSQFEQKTFIQVDRNGTKAAAITFAAVNDEAVMISLCFNRPFVWAIVDNTAGLPVFLGVVADLG